MQKQKLKILLIDDEPAPAVLLEGLLEGKCYIDLEYVDNGEEGIKKALLKNYDIYIVDIVMPKMDGIEVINQLHEKNGSHIIAFTQYELSEEQSLELFGKAEIIPKVDYNVLVSKIEDIYQMRMIETRAMNITNDVSKLMTIRNNGYH